MAEFSHFPLWFVPILSLLSMALGFPLRSLPLPRPPPLPVLPIPSSSQLSWQLGEMAMFLHFGPNTFTDSEWGTGQADPAIFDPEALDTRQWVRTAVELGFSRLVITAKHHDGFCLWPSAYTDYSVRSSPWKAGHGDVVAELAAAAREAGVGLGVYLSPWDRHDPSYGKTIDYNEYFLAQMSELLTRYGEIEEVFLDGAKGKNATDMEYFFDSWFKFIHQMQPKAVIFSDSGPDSRWVGNEAGAASPTCWSLFNQSNAAIGHTNETYSSEGDPEGRDWIAAECDVSIRPGWFWHRSEQPKSAANLLEIYYNSVGRNCFLILNVPPNSSGLIAAEDVQVLREFSRLRRSIFDQSLAQAAAVAASSSRDSSFDPACILQEGIHSYWAPQEDDEEWSITLEFDKVVRFNVVLVQEPIQMGQRISSFHVDFVNGGAWRTVAAGTTVGYKRLLRIPTVESQFLRLVIDGARADPLVAFLGVYFDPFSAAHERTEMQNTTRKTQLPHEDRKSSM
ncbi:alpha-L-fucosidase 1 [Wolffia australiana]